MHFDLNVIMADLAGSLAALVETPVDPLYYASIGAALLEYAVNDLGCTWLWALEYHTRGIAFYRRHGFEPTGETMTEDEWVPLVKLSRRR